MGWLTLTTNGATGLSADGWLKRLGLPRDRIGAVVRRIPGLSRSRLVNKARASRSANVDTGRSKAYGVPIFFNIMGIRVNGVGEEKEALCREIIGKLPEIVDPETGESIVQEVYRGRDYYQGPYAQNVPDIVVHFDPTYGCNYHLSRYSAMVTQRAIVSGPAKHRMEGIFIAAGSGIVASGSQPLPDLKIEDVAPTALHLMGLPIPADMDGRVLTEIFEPSFLRAQPITYEAPMGFWTASGPTTFEDTVMSPADEEVIRERLQSLGYFD
jgi:predicted AlkP superfamily phosphohydrolase/phosphomutase